MSRILSDSRGRLTPVDVVYYMVAILLIAFMAQPIYQVLTQRAGHLQTGEAYLFQLVVPALIVMILSVIFKTAAGGGR